MTALNLSRRRFLNGGLVGGSAVLVGAILAATPAAADSKFAQSMAKYQATPKGRQSCDSCSQYVANGSCRVVAGKISPTGWCLLYAAK